MRHMVGSALLVILIALGCGAGAGGREALPEQAGKVTRLAAPIAAELMGELKAELLGAMEAGGPLGALQFCQLRALPLTADVEARHPGISLKRVSERLRNPQNKPDAGEQSALDHFLLKERAEARVPDSWVQELRRDGERYFRHYAPIRIAKPCLNCHGQVDQLLPELQVALKQLYPEDEATMYHEGDFRGLLRVEVPASMIEEH